MGRASTYEKNARNLEMIRAYRETGNEDIRNTFFKLNEGLAYHVAIKFSNLKSYELEDRVAICMTDMLRAFERFDLDKGIAFNTYAIYVMNTHMLQLYRETKMQKRDAKVSSLNIEVNDEDAIIMDIIPDEEDHFESIIEDDFARDIMHRLLPVLSDVEKAILLRVVMKGETQASVGLDFGYTQKSVSRIQARVLERARMMAHLIGA